MSKHTPGPWRIGSLASYDGYTGQPYRNVWAGQGEAATVVARAIRSKGAMTNDVDADARLLAAAPDLLEALRVFVSAAYPVTTEINPRGHAWSEAYLDQALDNARAAIRAVEGEGA